MNTEDKIKIAIENTKDELRNLDVEPNDALCISSLSTNLEKQCIHYETVSTSNYDYPNDHLFIAISKNENELYILDLAYKPFQSDKFPELLQKGYMLIKGEQCKEYLDVVGSVKINERKKY